MRTGHNARIFSRFHLNSNQTSSLEWSVPRGSPEYADSVLWALVASAPLPESANRCGCIISSTIALVDICVSRIKPARVRLKTRQAMILTIARYGLIPIPFRIGGTDGVQTRTNVARPAINVILVEIHRFRISSWYGSWMQTFLEYYSQVVELPVDQ